MASSLSPAIADADVTEGIVVIAAVVEVVTVVDVVTVVVVIVTVLVVKVDVDVVEVVINFFIESDLKILIRSQDTIMLTSGAPHSLLFPCKEGAGRSTYLCPCPLSPYLYTDILPSSPTFFQLNNQFISYETHLVGNKGLNSTFGNVNFGRLSPLAVNTNKNNIQAISKFSI